ncbi:MAG: methyltransferase [Flavobacteriaceae bacterium]
MSTKVFLEYIATLELKKNNVLELGCGSGIISVFSASKGAKVTASDINKVALNSLKKVSTEQNFDIDCIYSDLFNNIKKSFEYIFVNPPYYPRNPKNIEEKAWFCGTDFDFFERFFFQVAELNLIKTNVFMILSDACDFTRIRQIAKNNNIGLKIIKTTKTITETNYINRIENLEELVK